MDIRNLGRVAVSAVAVLLDDESSGYVPRAVGEVARGVYCRTLVMVPVARMAALLEVLEHQGLVERVGGRNDGQEGWSVASRVNGVSEAEGVVSVDAADDREAFGEALAAVVDLLDLVECEAYAAYVPCEEMPTAVRDQAVRDAARVLMERRRTILALLDYARMLDR